MKVVVYAICKNERAFARRWMDSMSEADGVVVLDTGSTDGTAEELKALGARVEVETISPWRFDVARNRSLELVDADADICVCTDLDEVFHPGWRKALEAAWTTSAGQAAYRYTWSFTPQGQEDCVFWIEKIHRRHGYRWVHPVHEVLEWVGEGSPGPTIWAEGVQLDHHPDPVKSRGQYLPLLELAVAEAPEDDRNVHYLGREYLFHKRWDECIRTLKGHLAMPSARWRDERCASMRYIAQAYRQKGEPERARRWYLRAAAEAPHLREPLVELARLCYDQEDWEGVLTFTAWALELREMPRTYISDAAAWGSLPHDLRTIAFYQTGRVPQALKEAKKALGYAPEDGRLRENVTRLESMVS